MPWTPDWATHPGDHLAEHIAASGLTIDEFCPKHDLDEYTVLTVIHLHASVTADLADALEKATGMKAEIWMGLQRRWDERQRLERSV